MRAALARALSLVALVALLYDGTACLVSLATGPGAAQPNELAWRLPCPCGCAQHAATLIGVGLSQPAAPQALAALPVPPRAPVIARDEVPPPSAPLRAIDHVPISLA